MMPLGLTGASHPTLTVVTPISVTTGFCGALATKNEEEEEEEEEEEVQGLEDGNSNPRTSFFSPDGVGGQCCDSRSVSINVQHSIHTHVVVSEWQSSRELEIRIRPRLVYVHYVCSRLSFSSSALLRELVYHDVVYLDELWGINLGWRCPLETESSTGSNRVPAWFTIYISNLFHCKSTYILQ